ncbi:16S rRNA (cytosine(1402)-N(4))-methyltransferase [Candidatus Syntrophocurvum alkaliphilum]|uniref:Ribosomal RNA small subunit methyltransferase H n=1 Tax=Candidatus Syntrophocurvum alkaliphilum TaxID=2293317 RepID=A0A6I6DF61_9FIRM|nr:16S rRNA (cytosine(1402)-N(4))-methyltransferase [Candidatus Syntrophocurvum alkaliphilum]
MHKPVLLDETISYLVTDPQGIYVDCTLGGGGHLNQMAKMLKPSGKIIAIDKDLDIINKTKKNISFSNVEYIHSDFRYLDRILGNEYLCQINGIMMDLGVSSFQLDEADRGFSYHENARLDMRMNRTQELTAWDIINNFEEQDISKIIFEYGEERYARKIARAIVNKRKEQLINTTLELVDIIRSAVPAKYRHDKHPARRTFQALRIAVNAELDALKDTLPQAINYLKPGGRLCVITFHSLEDRLVKKFFKEESIECICPPDFPICKCEQKPRLKIITRKPIVPDEKECEENSRARSAKLRVASKI